VESAVEVTNAGERPVSPVEYIVRVIWVAARLVLVYYLGQQGSLFFYQVF
jgi:hypothetical protein